MINSQKLDILHVNNELVIARLPCTICPIFYSISIFSCYFTRLKAPEISRQKYEKFENSFIMLCLELCNKQCLFLRRNIIDTSQFQQMIDEIILLNVIKQVLPLTVR